MKKYIIGILFLFTLVSCGLQNTQNEEILHSEIPQKTVEQEVLTEERKQEIIADIQKYQETLRDEILNERRAEADARAQQEAENQFQ
ncbi:hypothetical protein MK079_02055 [Candidatus Gracilibacteria bacterium]|nr:hypothetical protein [Candidatus Gracilibacteria bacterium]